MGLVIGQAKYIVFPLQRINKLDNNLPSHREIKLIRKDYINKESEKTCLIDFKPKYTDNEEENFCELLEINDFNNENEKWIYCKKLFSLTK